jgi:N-acetylglucosamine-6-phosphate deacetylase
MTERHALTADAVFDGSRRHRDCAVVIDGPAIVGIVPRRELPATMPVHALPEGMWLAPGFIDVQVNGGGDVLFNDAPTPETIERIAAAHLAFGTTALLPTLITDTPAKMRAALEAVREAAGANPGVLGIHLEGPFLSPEKPGVHDPALFRVPGEADATALIEALIKARAGVMLVTLAPERVPAGIIRQLVAAGVIVAAGHTAATAEEIAAARAAGLTGFTHLFNAMPPLAARAPGPVGAALGDPDAWCGLIVDLRHVAPVVLRVALAARGWQRMMLVTDAMPTVGWPGDSFALPGHRVTRRDGALRAEDGTLAGSDLDMASAVRNAVEALGLPLEAALHMASRAPAEFLGLGDRLGRIAPGYRADMVLLDDGLRVTETWIGGAPSGL